MIFDFFRKKAQPKQAKPSKSGSVAGEGGVSTQQSNKSVAKTARADNAPPESAKQVSATSKTRKRNRQSNKKKLESNWNLTQFQVEPAEGKTRFHDLDLPLSLMQGIAKLGFQYCSPIQAKSLPLTLDGFDVVGKAQTGTGKTAAFLITAITEILNNSLDGERFLAEPRAVVIAPTRELVEQIGRDAQDLARYTDLRVVTMIGGADYQKQRDQLERGVVDIVAATPGRLIDFIRRGHISLNMVDVLVLDEADRMLDMGFIPQVRQIVRATPHRENRQTLLFSATFNYDVNIMIESWMVDPIKVEIEPENIAADTVDQRIYMVEGAQKFTVLSNVVKQEDVERLIVFANRRDQTRDVYEQLRKEGYSVGLLSGEVNQQKRSKTLKRFKEGDIKILVATDVAGRGIHVDGVSHVVNFNLPEDPEDYVHRIGRTGRAGSSGVSISLACEDDAFALPDIEKLLGKKLNYSQPPAELLQ